MGIDPLLVAGLEMILEILELGCLLRDMKAGFMITLPCAEIDQIFLKMIIGTEVDLIDHCHLTGATEIVGGRPT